MSAQLDTADTPKRRQILDAAGQLFLAEGFAAVSMDAIARGAGVSKATLYAYFPGKDALFGAMVSERCNAMLARDRFVTDHDAPLPEALRRLVDFWLRFLLNPDVVRTYRTVLAEGARFPDLARAFFEAGPVNGLRWIGEWFVEEQRRGRLRADFATRTAAMQFIAMLRGELYTKSALGLIDTPSEEAMAAEAAAATDTLLRAFAAPGFLPTP